MWWGRGGERFRNESPSPALQLSIIRYLPTLILLQAPQPSGPQLPRTKDAEDSSFVIFDNPPLPPKALTHAFCGSWESQAHMMEDSRPSPPREDAWYRPRPHTSTAAQALLGKGPPELGVGGWSKARPLQHFTGMAWGILQDSKFIIPGQRQESSQGFLQAPSLDW